MKSGFESRVFLVNPSAEPEFNNYVNGRVESTEQEIGLARRGFLEVRMDSSIIPLHLSSFRRIDFEARIVNGVATKSKVLTYLHRVGLSHYQIEGASMMSAS